MESINITNARNNLFNIAKSTLESHEPVTITTKVGDVVMISKEDYESLQETLYLHTNKGLAREAMRLKSADDSEFGTRDELEW
jgi:antitoxin YefM